MRTPLSRRVAIASLVLVWTAALAAACSSAGGVSDDGTGGRPGSQGGAAGTGGASGAASQGGGRGDSAAGGEAGTDGEGGQAGDSGAAGTVNVTGGSGGEGGEQPDGGLQDAKPDAVGDGGCVPEASKGPGPLPRVCAPATSNECDGKADLNPALPNGKYGNGYDDDCDGQVDEGCECDADHPVGTTRECFLVPSSQAQGGEPVGWCKGNSRGTTACVGESGVEGEITRRWDGFCKGAQFAFADDVCAPGDYDCDGKDSNSKGEECGCQDVEVTCPTDPIVVSPYPDPTNLEKKKPNPYDPKPNEPFVIDGHKWITKGDAAKDTSEWRWQVTGGDCDNILPHVTYAVFDGPDTTKNKRIGSEQNNAGSNKKQRSITTSKELNQHVIWPAFALSGDYVVSGAFKANNKVYLCSVKVQVRAPGLRAEMCWDMKNDGLGVSSSDVDLHLARLQGAATCGKTHDGKPGQHGWFDSCGRAPTSDDCFFDCGSGCRTGNTGFCLAQPAPAPGWGYAPSAGEACHGWGSLREAQQSCDNPRLDRDNLGCDTNVVDPNSGSFFGTYCGPENINLDNPNPGDAFAVGTHFYGGTVAHPHVNIYCNGERKLALGYDPTTEPATTNPTLSTGFNPPEGGAPAVTGDFWTAARVIWKGDPSDPCLIETVPSKQPKPQKDGSSALCVDTNAQNKSGSSSDLWLFSSSADPKKGPVGDLCWH